MHQPTQKNRQNSLKSWMPNQNTTPLRFVTVPSFQEVASRRSLSARGAVGRAKATTFHSPCHFQARGGSNRNPKQITQALSGMRGTAKPVSRPPLFDSGAFWIKAPSSWAAGSTPQRSAVPWLALRQWILGALGAISELIVQHYTFTPSDHLTFLGDLTPHYSFVAFADASN